MTDNILRLLPELYIHVWLWLCRTRVDLRFLIMTGRLSIDMLTWHLCRDMRVVCRKRLQSELEAIRQTLEKKEDRMSALEGKQTKKVITVVRSERKPITILWSFDMFDIICCIQSMSLRLGGLQSSTCVLSHLYQHF